MVKKRCNKCGISKGIQLFYKQKTGLLGRTGACKECRLSYQKRYGSTHQEKRNENDRKRYLLNREEKLDKLRIWRRKNPDYFKHYYYQNTQKKIEIDKRWRLNNPDRLEAYKIFSKAKYKGILKVPNKCSLCGEKHEKIQGHHNDYSKPLEIIWVCFPCHLHIHKKIRKIRQKDED